MAREYHDNFDCMETTKSLFTILMFFNSLGIQLPDSLHDVYRTANL